MAQEQENLHECRVLTAGADRDFLVEVHSEGVPFPLYVLTGAEFGCMLGMPREDLQDSIIELTDCHTQLRRVQEELGRLKSSVKAEILAQVLGGQEKPAE